MSVGLVLVSHSREVATGTAALAAQMAPSIRIAAAGGTDDGGIGTSFELISAALADAETGDGVVVLYDLGSAVLTAETAVEFCDPDEAARIVIVDAPLVEGAIAAAVTAESGADRAAVVAAARSAARSAAGSDAPAADAPAALTPGDRPVGDRATSTVVVTNPLGLHARPVATLVRALKGRDAEVRVGRPEGPDVDLRSVLGVVGLRLRGGDRLQLSASGSDAGTVLAELAQLITDGFGERDSPTPAVDPISGPDTGRLIDGVLQATPGAPGRAIGPLRRLAGLPDAVDPQPGADPTVERTRLGAAIAAAANRLTGTGEFAEAHAAMLSDPELRRAADRYLTDGAPAAWWRVVTAAAADWAASPDELVAARSVDLREAGVAVLAELGIVLDRMPADLAGSVVVAPDLGPAQIPLLAQAGVAAVVLAAGSVTAHAVIVARGLGLPMVLRAGGVVGQWADGTELIVDGGTGTVSADPNPALAARIRAEIDQAGREIVTLRAAAAAPVVLADGRTILVAANVGSVADARMAVACGADAVGLLRTELLVLDKLRYPDEDEQTRDLTEILQVLGDRPTVIRVLDAGGDKPVATLDVDAVHNGFLGIRGLRYLLANPDLLQTQLRAVCRAAVGHRVSVMAPMVTVAQEVRQFRAAVDAAVASLVTDDIEHAAPEQVGVMIEVPAAALAADEICAAADFVSIGSNDLTSYTMAADRTEPGVADLLDPSATAVQRLLDQLCAQAVAAGTPIAVCGEMAGMADQVAGLVARGVTELSMAPARIPAIKAQLRDS